MSQRRQYSESGPPSPSRGHIEWGNPPQGFLPVVEHAVPISVFILGLFIYWFAVADRYAVFLYGHLGATPFDDVTRSRYWMAGLVACGAVMVGYLVVNWLLGSVGLMRSQGYVYPRGVGPPQWWQIWALCALPLTIGIPAITMTVNWPTLCATHAAACVGATLGGLALALMPGSWAARRPSDLAWLALDGIGLMPALLLLRAVELPSRGLMSGPLAYGIALGGILAGAVWLGVMTTLRIWRHRRAPGAGALFVAGLCLSYLLMPLAHYLFATPPGYRYISTASNFFASGLGVQALALCAAGLLALSITRWRHRSPRPGGNLVLAVLQALCLVLIACLSVPPIPARAQANPIRFDRVSVEDGLSQNAVLTILQDARGFMWFGTEDGLNKYDGRQFIVHKHDPDDAGTLSDSFVSSIYEDPSGTLWIGTRDGLNQLKRETGTFIRYQHDPRDSRSLGGKWVVSICEGHDGALWLGTAGDGLDRLDRTTKVFTHYRHSPDAPQSLSDNTVTVVYKDHGGQLWVGTNGGLNRLDHTTGTFVHYRHDPSDPQSLSDDRVTAILEDGLGRLWIGTEGGGLDQLDRSSGTFIHHPHDPHDPRSLSHSRVRAILEDSTGRLWVGTQQGLDQLERDQGQFVHYRYDPYDPHSLSSDSVWSIYEDQGGVLWFGTYGGGLSKYNRATDQFTLYQHHPNRLGSLSDNMVWAIHEDHRGILWVGTFNGGLNRLDRGSDSFTIYRHDPNDGASLSSDDVRAILEDDAGVLWVGTTGGLDRFDPRTERFAHYRHDPTSLVSLSDNRVTVIHEDRLGNLWIGTRSGGLNRLDRATGSFIRYGHSPDDPSGLSDNRVWALYSDRSSALWVGTLGGIDVWDPLTDTFTHYKHDPNDPQSPSNDQAFAFYEDEKGTVWIGTWGSGLDRLDPASQTFTHYTEKDGLSNNTIYGIEADAERCLWLSTNRGLSKFDPRTDTFQNYDVGDGLQHNEFNVGAHFSNDSGRMFFGGVQGFNAFYPEQVKPSTWVPPVVITAFSKFNKIVRRDLPAGEHIELSYRDNFVSFEFAALDYSAPKKNQYAYRLEGFDQDWVYAGPRRHADYTNLRGGDYVFRVKGSNSDGIWDEEGVTLRVTVTPPFWETWAFRGVVLLAMVGSIVGGYRLRVRSIEARSRQLERQVRERTHEIEERRRELEALYRADAELYRYLRLDQVLQSLVHIAVDILQADKSSLMVWDDSRQRLVARAAHGFSPRTMAQMSFAPGEGGVGLAATTGEPVVVEDALADWRVAQRIMEPEGIRSLIHVPIKIDDQVFGVFNVSYLESHAFTDDEVRLFTALAQRAGLAIANAQLYGQAQELAVMEERQRLARDLHDAVTQTLFSASLIAEVLPLLWGRDPDEGQRRLEELRQLTRGALAEMRTLLLELRPTALTESELGDLLRQLAEAVTGRARVPVTVASEGQCCLPADVQVALYRIAQEALNNMAKHAGASHATVSLCCCPEKVALRVRDNGQGFDPTRIPSDHLGLGIMHERAEAIGAALTIKSEIGHGTEVAVVWSVSAVEEREHADV